MMRTPTCFLTLLAFILQTTAPSFASGSSEQAQALQDFYSYYQNHAPAYQDRVVREQIRQALAYEKRDETKNRNEALVGLVDALGGDENSPISKIDRKTLAEFLVKKDSKEVKKSIRVLFQQVSMQLHAANSEINKNPSFWKNVHRMFSPYRENMLRKKLAELDVAMTQFAAHIQNSPDFILVQFLVKKSYFLQRFTDLTEALIGRYGSFEYRVDELQDVFTNFLIYGKFSSGNTNRDIWYNQKINESEKNEKIKRIVWNRQNVTAGAIAIALIGEAIAVVFTAGAAAAAMAPTAATLQAVGTGAIIAESSISLIDRVSMQGFRGLASIESLMDILFLVSVVKIPVFKNLTRAQKIAKVWNIMSTGSGVAWLAVTGGYSAYLFLNADRIARETGQSPSQVRTQAMIQFAMVSLGGIATYRQMKTAKAEAKRSQSNSEPTSSGNIIKSESSNSKYNSLVGTVEPQKLLEYSKRKLSRSNVKYKEQRVTETLLNGKTVTYDCIMVMPTSTGSVLNKIAYRLLKNRVGTHLLFCPGLQYAEKINAGFTEPNFSLPGQNMKIGDFHPGLGRLYMPLDAIMGLKANGNAFRSNISPTLAHELHHVILNELRYVGKTSLYHDKIQGANGNRYKISSYESFMSLSELSTFSLQISTYFTKLKRNYHLGTVKDLQYYSSMGYNLSRYTDDVYQASKATIDRLLSKQIKNQATDVQNSTFYAKVDRSVPSKPAAALEVRSKLSSGEEKTLQILFHDERVIRLSQERTTLLENVLMQPLSAAEKQKALARVEVIDQALYPYLKKRISESLVTISEYKNGFQKIASESTHFNTQFGYQQFHSGASKTAENLRQIGRKKVDAPTQQSKISEWIKNISGFLFNN